MRGAPQRRTIVLVACRERDTVELIQRAMTKAEGAVLDVSTVEGMDLAIARLDLARHSADRARSDETRVDVVLLDLGIRGTESLEPLEAVQAVAPGIPVVALVSFFGTRLGMDAVAHGAQDYFVKGRGGGDSLVRAVLGSIERNRQARARAELLAAIAHEFRTRLFTIVTHAETMLDPDFEPPDEGWRKEFGTEIRDAAREIVDRLNQILELTELAAGGSELHIEDVSVAEVLGEARPVIVELAAGAPGVGVSLDVPAGVPPARADRTRLREILLALISRAIAESPRGGTVRVEAAASGTAVQVSVTDEGTAVPDEEAELLFEPFYRLNDPLAAPSGGVGLALTRHLVEAQGGRIWLSSRPGLGTTLTFTLPAAKRAR